jgi:hypothetical protein
MNKLEKFYGRHRKEIKEISDTIDKSKKLETILKVINFMILMAYVILMILIFSTSAIFPEFVEYLLPIQMLIAIIVSITFGLIILVIFAITVLIKQLNAIILINALYEEPQVLSNQKT